jgi:DNA repair protein RecN (Recombination protein N)
VDPARLAELEERLNLLHSLKRKYGATLAEVIAFGDEAKQKLQSLESRDAELARLNAALEKLDAEILNAGKKLSAARKKVIPQLAKAVSKQLEDLGFKQSKFDVAISTIRWGEATDEPNGSKTARGDARPTSRKCGFIRSGGQKFMTIG